MNKMILSITRSEASHYRQELDALGPPDVVKPLITRIRNFVASASESLNKIKAEASDAFNSDYMAWNGTAPKSPAPVDRSRSNWAIRAGAWAELALETGFGAFLAAITFNLPAVFAALIGIAITVVLTLVFKGIWSMLTHRHQQQPRKVARSLQIQLLVVSALWVVALTGALLLGRTLDAATPLVNTVFALLMTALTILSPLMAAILLTYADVTGWARGHVRQWHELEKLELMLRSLNEYCDAVEARLFGVASPEAVSGHDAEVPPMLPSGIATALLLLLLAPGALAKAQCTNQLWIDLSPSPAKAELSATVETALGLIPAIADSECGNWELYGFAGSGFSATPFDKIPQSKHPSGECNISSPRGEVDKLFSKPAKALEAEHQSRCDEFRKRANDDYQKQTVARINDARTKLNAFKVDGPNRTCIADLLIRLSQETADLRRVFVLTDGVETCTPSGSAIPNPKIGEKVILVIVSPQVLPHNLTEAGA